MRFQFNQEDLLRGTLVKPSWYDLEIFAVEDNTAKSTGAIGVKVSFKIISEGTYKGVPVDVYYYESAPGFSKQLIGALGVSLKAGDQFDFDEKLIGKKVAGYIQNVKDNKDRPKNDIGEFRSLKKVTA